MIDNIISHIGMSWLCYGMVWLCQNISAWISILLYLFLPIRWFKQSLFDGSKHYYYDSFWR